MCESIADSSVECDDIVHDTLPPAKAVRLRVLVICGVNGHGGPIQSMKSVLRSERACSIDATIATQLPRVHRKDDLTSLSARVIPIVRPRGGRLIWAQCQLLARSRWIRSQIDVIHANGLTEAAIALPVSIVTGIPVVVWVHNSSRPRAYAAVEPLLRWMRRRWKFLAVSSLAAAQVKVARAAIVPNPIDHDVLAKRCEPSSSIRVTYLAGTDKYTKGFDLLPGIISASRADGIEWRIYTSSPYSSRDSRCRDAWTRLLASSARNVVLLERVETVSTAFESCDLVIALSRMESFNRVVAESLANGVPVVASDIGPHRELLSRGGGVLFASENCSDAARVIDLLSSDRALRDRMAKAAKESAVDFDAERISGEIIDAWRSRARCQS